MKGFCPLHEDMKTLDLACGKACYIQNNVHVQLSNQPIGPEAITIPDKSDADNDVDELACDPIWECRKTLSGSETANLYQLEIKTTEQFNEIWLWCNDMVRVGHSAYSILSALPTEEGILVVHPLKLESEEILVNGMVKIFCLLVERFRKAKIKDTGKKAHSFRHTCRFPSKTGVIYRQLWSSNIGHRLLCNNYKPSLAWLKQFNDSMNKK